MDLLLHFIEHALEDTLVLVPFLFVTYIALEALEHAAGARANAVVRRAGAAGPVAGALLGVVPQCGFSAMAATLYAGRVVTLGTLVAVFLSTSDEMLPMLVAERVDAGLLFRVLGLKVLVALITGVLADLAIRALRKNTRVHAFLRRTVFSVRRDGMEADVHVHEGEHGHERGYEHGHEDADGHVAGCDHDHGHDHGHSHAGGRFGIVGSIVMSAVSHTVQVSLFIFLVTFALVLVLETVGEDALAAFLSGNQLLAVFASALVGLVPNCSASVVITQLYLEGVLGFAPLMAGLLTSAGVGYLVLFRTNRHPRENAVIVVGLFLVACVWGLVFAALGM